MQTSFFFITAAFTKNKTPPKTLQTNQLTIHLKGKTLLNYQKKT